MEALRQQCLQHEWDLFALRTCRNLGIDVEAIRWRCWRAVQKGRTLDLSRSDSIGQHDKVAQSDLNERQGAVTGHIEARRAGVDESVLGIGRADAGDFEFRGRLRLDSRNVNDGGQ